MPKIKEMKKRIGPSKAKPKAMYVNPRIVKARIAGYERDIAAISKKRSTAMARVRGLKTGDVKLHFQDRVNKLMKQERATRDKLLEYRAAHSLKKVFGKEAK